MAEPVYILNTELLHITGNIGLQLCQAAETIEPYCAIGAQKIRAVWYLYLETDYARRLLLEANFGIQNKQVNILSRHPFESVSMSDDDAPPLEQIVFKDIPLCDPNGDELILAYLRSHKQIKIAGPLCSTRYTIKGKKSTPFLSGERSILVQADFSPPLPGNTQMGKYNVRVSHRSQKVFCQRCCTDDHHRTSDVSVCPSYRHDDVQTVAFRGDYNIMSNYFITDVVVYGKHFRSAEHAFQFRKCDISKRDDLAQQILTSSSPSAAKRIASGLSKNELQRWHKDKLHIKIMYEVLHAKAVSNIDFHNALLNTGDKMIAECTKDRVWGSGLSPFHTRTSHCYPGANLTGKILMDLRERLKDSSLSSAAAVPYHIITDNVDTSRPPPPLAAPPTIKPSDINSSAASTLSGDVTHMDTTSTTTTPHVSSPTIGDDSLPAAASNSVVSPSPTSDISVVSPPSSAATSGVSPPSPDVKNNINASLSPAQNTEQNVPPLLSNESAITLQSSQSVPTTPKKSKLFKDDILNRPPFSPLAGILLCSNRRRATAVRRLPLVPDDNIDNNELRMFDYNSMDNYLASETEMGWDHDSIASEIICSADFEGEFANAI